MCDNLGWSQLGSSYVSLGKTHSWLFVELEGQLGLADLQWACLEWVGSLGPLSSNRAQASSHFLSLCLHGVCLCPIGQSKLRSQSSISRVRPGETEYQSQLQEGAHSQGQEETEDFSPRHHKEPLLILLFIYVCFLSLCPSCLLSSPLLPLSLSSSFSLSSSNIY